ncbi:MAG TPA: trypsin-like peptidase domain-containing protein [Gemmatimonadales bacterium]|nr:trypsin-like peptidase domain-containing protein [Gemmatimonadales bacterium]
MSSRTLNWLKFGGLVSLAFVLGLFFAGLLNLPSRSAAQERVVPASVGSAKALPSSQALRTLDDLSEAFSSVAESVKPSVVYIKAQHTEKAQTRKVPPGMEQFFPHLRQGPEVEQGSGSGFIVSNDGYILTNNHVVENADQVTVRLLDHREFRAKVVGADPNTDVAVLKIDATGLTAANLGNSDNAHVGSWILAIGNPLGEALTFTVTSGIVSARGRLLNDLRRSSAPIQDFIQTDAAINPGNSGGPLVNVRGEVIGINSAIASENGLNAGYGFAIPINLARRVMDQLIATGKVQRAALGIAINDASATDAAYVGLKEIRGVKVEDLPDDSPAKAAGIEPGDVIIAVDGKQMDYTSQLQQDIGFRRPGEVVKVTVARKGGITKTFSIKLTELKDAPQVAAKGNDSDNDTAPDKGAAISPLGITVQPLTADMADQLNLESTMKGLVVTQVEPNGPAWEVLSDGTRGAPPDIILSVEGKPVRTESELRTALHDAGNGAIVTLRVFTPTQSGGVRRIERIQLVPAK